MKKNISRPAEIPLLTAGIVTDTHIREEPASCRKVRRALELFRELKADLIINCGDIANHHAPEGYRHYRELIDSTFAQAEKKPGEIFVYAGHDRGGDIDPEQAFPALKKHLKIPHAPDCELKFAGYTFLVFDQYVDMEQFEKTIAEAVKKSPGKPVFVIDHVPPARTFHNSVLWGSEARRQVMEKFPGAVHISGHIHGSVHDELCIWQGPFTAVSAGCLSSWGGEFAGSVPRIKPSDGVLFMEVFKDRIRFRRYDLTTKREYAPERRWCVPWPFRPETAPYDPERLKEERPAPLFPPRARLTMTPCGRKFEELKLRFTPARPDVYLYRVRIEKKSKGKGFEQVAVKEECSSFWQAPSKAARPMEITLSGGYFEPRKSYRITLTPVNFWGKEGNILSGECTIPAAAPAKVLFESKDPMAELPFLTDLKEGHPLKKEGDLYFDDAWNTRLELPEKVWNIPGGAKLRFIADIRTVQETERRWVMNLRNPEPLVNGSPRIHTAKGDLTSRFVIDFEMIEGFKFYLLIRSGDPGRIGFKYVRLEQLPDEGNEC